MKTGQLVMTNGVHKAILKNKEFGAFILDCLTKYVQKDWGDTCKEDWLLNDEAEENGNDRIVALYRNYLDGDIFIITDADRFYTTVLFCYEY